MMIAVAMAAAISGAYALGAWHEPPGASVPLRIPTASPPAAFPAPRVEKDLVVLTRPSGAKVSWGDRELGSTPLMHFKLPMDASGTLKIAKTGFLPVAVETRAHESLGTWQELVPRAELKPATQKIYGRVILRGDVDEAIAAAKALLRVHCSSDQPDAAAHYTTTSREDFIDTPRRLKDGSEASFHCRFRIDDLLGPWQDSSRTFTTTYSPGSLHADNKNESCDGPYTAELRSGGASVRTIGGCGGGSSWQIDWDATNHRWTGHESQGGLTFTKL